MKTTERTNAASQRPDAAPDALDLSRAQRIVATYPKDHEIPPAFEVGDLSALLARLAHVEAELANAKKALVMQRDFVQAWAGHAVCPPSLALEGKRADDATRAVLAKGGGL
jgi:hypothetical protein